ncbi:MULTISPECIES: hypothetical protein [unclassified Thermoactinomyces]|uniref:hypothetical protein n=1 Tax=unclassified Thermoactinomyces TaxID=2634588 RepID=UPI0018DB4EFA|nr:MULTISPECIES: hypothetical protein [unclassified Thermoactinomyces]MBH8599210.1 hypothetical protein [Thermoactinomyces sp. CICC 10523]MBH8605364.1 hypothetical protein [Thermoactinomyces sp. CICC 10522]MBH8609296.1 hypothetical protein [Thermoactinomyces sp. CICC 10521]
MDKIKKVLAGLLAFLFVFVLSSEQSYAATFVRGKAVVTSEHSTSVFYAKAGEIYFKNDNLADREYIDIRIELYKKDGTLVQTRIGNAYNFVSHADSPYTVPEDGYYFFRLVNETPDSHWYVKYSVSDRSRFWN